MKRKMPDLSTEPSEPVKPYSEEELLTLDLPNDLERTLATMEAYLKKLEKEKQETEK